MNPDPVVLRIRRRDPERFNREIAYFQSKWEKELEAGESSYYDQEARHSTARITPWTTKFAFTCVI